MPRIQKLVWLLAVLFVLGRFIGLDQVPYGFMSDEASGAMHALCIAEHGRDAHGNSWPLFVNQFESPFQERVRAGEIPPTYLYLQAAWVKVFGASISSVRAFNGFLSAALTLAVGWLAWLLFASPVAAAFAALSAAAAPAFFHIVRLATMVPLGPLFLVLAVAFAIRNRKPYLDLGLSGLFFALAAVSYPPLKVQVVAIAPLWFFFAFKREGKNSLKPYLFGAAVLAAFMIPLAIHSFSDEATLRAKFLSVFTEQYARAAGESNPSFFFYARALIANFSMHLDPGFLFFHGDANLRHSTGYFGSLSWLDAAAFLGAVIFLGRARFRKETMDLDRTVLVLFASAAFGILPAALTWEGVPHVLRSIGAFPFLCVLSGRAVAFVADRWAWATRAGAVLAMVFALTFGWVYFRVYPAASHGEWEPQFRTVAEKAQAAHAWENFKPTAENPRVSKVVLNYYPATMGGEGCWF